MVRATRLSFFHIRAFINLGANPLDMKPTLRLICCTMFYVGTISYASAQTCQSGKLDDRVASFIKSAGAEMSLVQLRSTPIQKFKQETSKSFKRLPADSIKRVKIAPSNFNINVVSASAKTGLPVILNFHGGGFVTPLLPSMEYDAMRLARHYNAVVFDVDYRTAPENKFPAAHNDAYAAYKWVLEHAAEYGGDPSKVILHGNSSGANLVASVAHKAKKENAHLPIKLAVMICPPTDNPNSSYYGSYEENAKGYVVTKDLSLFFFEQYLDKTEWYKNNPEMWPIYHQDVAGMPKSLIVTTEFDVLRDEGIAYAKKLEKAGSPVQIICYPHMIHDFAGLPANAKERTELRTIIGEAIKVSLDQKSVK